jgi:voltage-gated potassium channel Kch
MTNDMTAVDERIRDHVIVCGFGQFTKAVLEYLGTTSAPIVFVEPDTELETQLMLARKLNPAIEIHARAESADGTRWLQGAGATEVVDPYRIAARAIVRELYGGSKDS